MKRALFFCTLFATLALGARADSMFGAAYLGTDVRVYDARIEGRGGAGIAARDSMNAATKLPTQLLDLDLVSLSFTGVFESRTAEDGFGSVERNRLQVPSLRIGLPLGPRAAFGFGFSAMRATQWVTEAPSELDPQVTEVVDRRGTRFEFPLELAIQAHRKLRFAAGALFEGGTISTQWSARIPGASVNPANRREETLEAWTWRIAASVHDVGPLQFGGYYVPEHDGEVNIDLEGVALDANDVNRRDDQLPARWGLGAGLEFERGWNAYFDYEAEDFSGYRGRGFLDENGQSVGLRDEHVWRVGIEKEPSRLARGLAAQSWRAGFYRRSWHYRVAGQPLSEWAITLGSSIDLRLPGTKTDLSLSYGRIGSLDDNGAEESFFRLLFSITGGEKWY